MEHLDQDAVPSPEQTDPIQDSPERRGSVPMDPRPRQEIQRLMRQQTPVLERYVEQGTPGQKRAAKHILRLRGLQ